MIAPFGIRGYQKIPKGLSEDTKGVIRRYQRGYQKDRRTDNAMGIRKRTNNELQHIKQKIKDRAKPGVNSDAQEV
jgi:hypothetical protein